ncbi:ATP-binding cassette domain-containing protein [Myxococcota bacterium]|nr:ATP-binding cassette domain-containing protein [Myxococcota bacterium]
MQPVSSFRRLLTLARPESRRLIIATVALFVSAGVTLLYPVAVQKIVDGVLKGEGRVVVDDSAMALLALFLVGSVFGGVRAYLFTVAGERVVTQLRRELYAALIRQEIAFFDERRTGELTSRLAADTAVLQSAVTVNLSMLLRFLVMALGGIGALFWTSWRLTVVTLAIVPLVVVGAAMFGSVFRRTSREVQDALARATEVAEETLSGVRTVRAFAREDAEILRYGAAVEESFEKARYRAWIGALFRGVGGLAGYGAIVVVLWYGGTLLVDGRMSMGELSSFLLYTLTVAVSLGSLATLWEDFQKALGASERVFELLDRSPTVRSGGARVPEVLGQIELTDVQFAYPSRADKPVLQGLSLSLRPGEVVALVGPSGGGKSTVAALLSRFYDPQGGQITLDGVPYPELDVGWLREQVGVVSQEPILFATTIAENIRYGRPAASDAEVEAAAKAANAHDFIQSFPDGYATLVGERGVRLSGGQKQRVAIARAILKDPKVLVLDEATSALDSESEHLVQEALERLMVGRTTLVIAHRLSTVKEADRVVVIDGGRAMQEGPHEELVRQDGLYRRLVERQFAA